MDAAAGRLLFRTLTNEQNTTVLPDSPSTGGQGVDTYLQRGLEEFSRQVGGYFVKTGTVTITDVAQEFDLPTDFVDVLWVRHNSLYLKRTTEAELLTNKVNWTTTAAATPTEYAVVGEQLLFYPKPSAAAVSADSTPDVRYLATPPAYTSSAFDQVHEQDHPLPVYYAAALFIQLHNDVPEMQARAKNLLELFYKGCEGARPFYERKRQPGRRTP